MVLTQRKMPVPEAYARQWLMRVPMVRSRLTLRVASQRRKGLLLCDQLTIGTDNVTIYGPDPATQRA